MCVDHPDQHDQPDAQEFGHGPPFGAHVRYDGSDRWHCPLCSSAQVEQRQRARRIGSIIGTIAGAIGGASRALAGYEIGLAVGAASFGPPGAALGAISGAVVSALMGGTTGGVIGTKLGSAIDATILDDYRCLSCQHTFSLPSQT